RSKLWFGFGGLLVILVIVSIMSIAVLTRYSHALEQMFRENYDSAIYCNEMKDSLDQLNARALQLIWNKPQPSDRIDSVAQIERFETNLNQQLGNTTLPGEADLSKQLGQLWERYKSRYQDFESMESGRDVVYQHDLLPQFNQLTQLAQRVADMNMQNMVSVDGQVKHTLTDVRNALLFSVVAGTILATTFIGIVGAAILESVRALTRSANQVEAGNLDLLVDVRSRDEIGQLASAFNSMAFKLREFRQLDHEKLMRIQRTTQLAIDSLPDAVFVIDSDGTIEISNRTAKTHFDVTPGKKIGELQLNWLSEIHQSVLRDAQPFEPIGYRSAIQLFENGQERFLLPHAVPMRNQNGAVLGVTVILVDVTRLRHADELKSDLVSTVSHELRTPLTSIRMGVILMAEEKLGPLTPRQQTSLAAVREDAERLHRIIENLLSMGRIEAGETQFQFQSMAAREIVSQAVDPLRASFAEKGVRLEIELADDLPSIRADPSCVGLAVTNLLSNALKFTPAGGDVRVSADANEHSLTLSVSDTGPGIPDEYASRIFEKFFRVPQRDGPTGAGLGLAIAKEIVEAHGGTIRFESSAGTTFTLTFPVHETHSESP
ncbi:MAG TPA: ATP-binding protein, partial [Tepidisphaeraceae bacterium]|nr:ATP-binding protein [Tepidisphaeraceae bacterium]